MIAFAMVLAVTGYCMMMGVMWTIIDCTGFKDDGDPYDEGILRVLLVLIWPVSIAVAAGCGIAKLFKNKATKLPKARVL